MKHFCSIVLGQTKIYKCLEIILFAEFHMQNDLKYSQPVKYCKTRFIYTVYSRLLIECGNIWSYLATKCLFNLDSRNTRK